MTHHKNKWESVGLMDGYYVVGVNGIPYPRFGVIINIISNEDIAKCFTINDIHAALGRTSQKCHLNL